MNEIAQLRKEIDTIDSELVKLLCRRMEVAQKIGREKKKANQTVLDSSREKQVIKHAESVAQGKLSREFIEKLFIWIMQESKRLQTKGDSE